MCAHDAGLKVECSTHVSSIFVTAGPQITQETLRIFLLRKPKA